MKNIKTTILPLLLVGTMLSLASFRNIEREAAHWDETSTTYIKMYVDGLACPFCAYGLEKKIKKVDGAKDLFIEINEGYITFTVPTSKKPSEEALQKLVKEAGFTVRSITYSATPFAADDAK